MAKPSLATFGPIPIEAVPIRNFSRIPKGALEAAWHLVGPSAQKNLQLVPLWKVIAAAYLEGLSHGAANKPFENKLN